MAHSPVTIHMTNGNPTMQHVQITTRDGGVLVGDVQGPQDAPVVVLVHGYPDTRLVWQQVATRLATTRRVARFDVRGAGDSFAPRGIKAYALPELAADIGQIIDHVSPDAPAHLVGHDWGGIQSWEAAADPTLSQRIASLTTISGPCLDHIGHWLRQHAYRHPNAMIRQLLGSWYIGALHIPAVPTLAWSLALGRRWPTLIAEQEGTPVDPDPTQTITGSHGAALYRANMLPRLLHPRKRAVQMPVQTVVPTRDRYVSEKLADTADPWVTHRRRIPIDAGHWLPLSHPQWLAARIQEFTVQSMAREDRTTEAPGKIGPHRATDPIQFHPTEAAP